MNVTPTTMTNAAENATPWRRRNDVAVADGAERDDRPPDASPERREVLPVDEGGDEADQYCQAGSGRGEVREDPPARDSCPCSLLPAQHERQCERGGGRSEARALAYRSETRPIIGVAIMFVTDASPGFINLVSALVYVFVLPAAGIILALLFYDLRARKEAAYRRAPLARRRARSKLRIDCDFPAGSAVR